MKQNTFTIISLGAVILGSIITGCRKNPSPPIDPHSPAGVNYAIQSLQLPLSEALRTNNLQFIHNQMFYLESLADNLTYQLEGDQKQRVADLVVKLKHVAEDLDNSAGRQHRDATEANLRFLFAVFKELDAELKPPSAKK